MKQNFLPVTALLMSLVFGSCTREAKEPEALAEKQQTLPDVISLSSLPNGKTEIEYTEEGQQHRVELQDSRITALFINGAKMPEETHVKHQASVQRMLQQINGDQQKMTPPKAEGPGTGNVLVEVIAIGKTKTSANEKTDKERAEAERKLVKHP
jgi:hypothetical protein